MMGLSSFASLESDSVDFCNHVLIYRENTHTFEKGFAAELETVCFSAKVVLKKKFH